MATSGSFRVGALVGLGLAALWGAPTAGAQTLEERAAQAARQGYDGPMNQLLLKDHAPHSNLVVPEHHPARARFPVVDLHMHPWARGPADVASWVELMDAAGVETGVVLTGAVGEAFDRLVELFLDPYPERFQLYCGMDTGLDLDAPDFPERVAAELERCYRRGGRGVGEVTDKGWGFGAGKDDPEPRPRARRLHVDDPRLDLYWRKCAELGMPVALHIADHPSAWQPDDRHQERTPSAQRFNQHGLDVPTHAELIERFLRLVERHPRTTFVAVHFANLGHDLAQLGGILDRFPNLFVDISARAYEFGRQPVTAHDFFRRYKDRILYGSDQYPLAGTWPAWWRILETRDEFIQGPQWWRLYGLGLPDDVLEAVYRGNARRLLNWAKP